MSRSGWAALRDLEQRSGAQVPKRVSVRLKRVELHVTGEGRRAIGPLLRKCGGVQDLRPNTFFSIQIF